MYDGRVQNVHKERRMRSLLERMGASTPLNITSYVEEQPDWGDELTVQYALGRKCDDLENRRINFTLGYISSFNECYVTLVLDGRERSHHRVDLSRNKLGSITMNTRQWMELCLLSGQLYYRISLVEPFTLTSDGIEVAGGT